MSYYITNFSGTSGCTVTYNGVTLGFDQFFYSSSNNGTTYTPTPASGVTVTPAPPPGNDGPGLNFNPGIGVGNEVGSGQVDDVAVGFTVTDLTPNTLIDDVYIALNAPVVTGTGNISYSETICLTTGTCTIYVDDPTTALATSINLAQSGLGGPVSTLSITKDVTLSGGSSGTAFMSFFQNEYSTVPEPRAVSLLLGLGLLAGLAIFKRRQAAQN